MFFSGHYLGNFLFFKEPNMNLALLRQLSFSVLAFFLATKSAAHSKKVAITIDDLPVVWDTHFPENQQLEIFRKILTALHKYQVKTIGFTIGGAIKNHQEQLLTEMLLAGHEIGNHSYSHPDFNNTTIDTYRNDILRGDEALSVWRERIRYFRFPYLHRGNTEFKKAEMASFLSGLGYKVVPVSILSRDWAYNADYIHAWKLGDEEKMQSIGRAYLQHIKDVTHTSEVLADAKLGRTIDHILLLHMNFINSVYLEDVLDWYHHSGWKFLTTEDALTDPVYDLEDQYTGPGGISWLDRILLTPDS